MKYTRLINRFLLRLQTELLLTYGRGRKLATGAAVSPVSDVMFRDTTAQLGARQIGTAMRSRIEPSPIELASSEP
jgi:hypothetical protein